MINILNIKPNVVSKDLRSYAMLFYGAPKVGKTTIATKFPKPLLLAFEKGYLTIPGIMPQDINSWEEFIQVLMQLDTPAAREMYSTIIIDTADIAYDYCGNYIIKNSVGKDGIVPSTIGEVPFGSGWGLKDTEFDKQLRRIIKMNYGLILVSHEVDKSRKETVVGADGKKTEVMKYVQIEPSLGQRGNAVIAKIVDVYGYARSFPNPDTESPQLSVSRLFVRATPRYKAGTRFKYLEESMPFDYESLSTAISLAIDKENQEVGNGALVTETFIDRAVAEDHKDFFVLGKEFQEITAELMEKDAKKYGSRIVSIVNDLLGMGKKVSDMTEIQVDTLELIVIELRKLKEKQE